MVLGGKPAAMLSYKMKSYALLDERGARRAAARAEWFSAQHQPLELHDIIER